MSEAGRVQPERDPRPEPGTDQGGCAFLRVRKLTRRVTQIYDQAMAPSGLTMTQYGLIAHIGRHPGIGIGDLASLLLMDPTTLSRLLKPLERQGLVLAVAAEDRRRRQLTLADEGRRTWREAMPLWQQAQDELADRLGPDGMAGLRFVLDQSLLKLTAS